MAAHLETLVAAFRDSHAEGIDKLKPATADDYAALELRLVPRSAAQASPAWGSEVKGESVIQAGTCIIHIPAFELAVKLFTVT